MDEAMLGALSGALSIHSSRGRDNKTLDGKLAGEQKLHQARGPANVDVGVLANPIHGLTRASLGRQMNQDLLVLQRLFAKSKVANVAANELDVISQIIG
jgi:hypothetical protein